MNGKIDDVRLPYSTVDPVMGDLFAVHWEPEVLQSMGQTLNILATEVYLPLVTVYRTNPCRPLRSHCSKCSVRPSSLVLCPPYSFLSS